MQFDISIMEKWHTILAKSVLCNVSLIPYVFIVQCTYYTSPVSPPFLPIARGCEKQYIKTLTFNMGYVNLFLIFTWSLFCYSCEMQFVVWSSLALSSLVLPWCLFCYSCEMQFVVWSSSVSSFQSCTPLMHLYCHLLHVYVFCVLL